MNNEEERISIPREKVLELQCKEQTLRATRAEFLIAQKNLQTAEAEHLALARELTAHVQEGGDYELVGTLDEKTCTQVRKLTLQGKAKREAKREAATPATAPTTDA